MKSFRASVFQGSSLVTTVEDIRCLLETGHEVFINRQAYSTHAAKSVSKWAVKTIELSNDYQGETDLEAEISFMPKVYPTRKLKPIVLNQTDSPTKLPTVKVTTSQSPCRMLAINDDQLVQSLDSLVGSIQPAIASSAFPIDGAVSTRPPSQKHQIKSIYQSKAAISTARAISKADTQQKKAEPAELDNTIVKQTSEKLRFARLQAQARVRARQAEREHQAIQQTAAHEASALARLERNDQKVRDLQEKTLARVTAYQEQLAQRDELTKRQQAECVLAYMEDQEKVSTRSYVEKMRQLQLDARRRLERFQAAQLALLEKEQQRVEAQLRKSHAAKDTHTTFKVARVRRQVFVHNVDAPHVALSAQGEQQGGQRRDGYGDCVSGQVDSHDERWKRGVADEQGKADDCREEEGSCSPSYPVFLPPQQQLQERPVTIGSTLALHNAFLLQTDSLEEPPLPKVAFASSSMQHRDGGNPGERHVLHLEDSRQSAAESDSSSEEERERSTSVYQSPGNGRSQLRRDSSSSSNMSDLTAEGALTESRQIQGQDRQQRCTKRTDDAVAAAATLLRKESLPLLESLPQQQQTVGFPATGRTAQMLPMGQGRRQKLSLDRLSEVEYGHIHSQNHGSSTRRLKERRFTRLQPIAIAPYQSVHKPS
jgi:hypothetical protein